MSIVFETPVHQKNLTSAFSGIDLALTKYVESDAAACYLVCELKGNRLGRVAVSTIVAYPGAVNEHVNSTLQNTPMIIRKIVPAFLILFSFIVTSSPAADFTSLGSAPLRLLRNHPHTSLPNPDAPALKSFMDGNEAGTMLATTSWPAHYRIGVVRIEFQPDENPRTTGNGTWGDIPFFTFSDSVSATVVEDPTVDSRSKLYIQRNLLHVSQYYEKTSGGKVIFEVPDSSDISSIIRLDVELAEYGNDDDYSLRTSNFAKDAIEAADNELDFSNYDVIMVFHAGCGQHTDFDEQSPDDLHPVSINHILLREILADGDPGYQGIATNDQNPDGSTHHVQFVQIFPETAVQDWEDPDNVAGGLQGLLGVMVHELGHFFGLPDLYDTFVGTRPAVGFYALMATGFFNTVSRIPSSMSAWSRVFLGWEEPLVVTGDLNDVVLGAAMNADSPLPRIIKVPISSTEYYLLELRLRDENFNGRFDYHETGGNTFPDIMEDDYRLPDGTLAEFDWSIPNALGPNIPEMTSADSSKLGSGVLIWHIDEQVIRENFTRDLTLNFVNTEPQHLGIALKEADGLNHMLEPFPASLDPGFGSPFDVFGGEVPGAKSTEEGNLNVNFGPFTSPNTTSYTGVASNIEISGFNSVTVAPGQPVVDSLVSVDINFNAIGSAEQMVHPIDGWPVIVGPTSSTPVVGDIDPGIHGLEVVQTNINSKVYSFGTAGETVIFDGGGLSANNNSPAIGDITGDGQADIVSVDFEGRVLVHTLRSNFDFVDGYPKDLIGEVHYSPVLADVDGDGALDVLIVTTDGNSSELHVLDENGSEMNGYPVEFFSRITARPSVLENTSGQVESIFILTANRNLVSLAPSGSAVWTTTLADSSVCAPVVGLMGRPGSGESYRVNVFGASGEIFSLRTADGSMVDGWPVKTDGICRAGGALGDVDDDGLNELVVPVDFPVDDYSARNKIYVLDYNGSSAAGMPIMVGSPRQLEDERYLSQPTLADVDGDGTPEILVTTAERLVLAFRGDGGRRPVARYITGGYSLTPPVAADIDSDGDLELICSDGEGYVYAYATGGSALSNAWSGMGGNPRHSGFTNAAQQDPGLASADKILPEKLCYLFPNPVRGSRANLTYQLGGSDVQRVTVEVFTVSGERVANFEGPTDAAAGLANQVTWDVDSYASGVYLVLIKVYTSSGSTVKTIRKMAVIK
jgi:M6 family metalloprotease-like protein